MHVCTSIRTVHMLLLVKQMPAPQLLQVEAEGQRVKAVVEAMVERQVELLEEVNQRGAEWGHVSLTLPNLPHHLHVKVDKCLIRVREYR